MLTAKQHELLHFIHTRLEESGISPSFEEMKDALGLKSKSGIHRLIGALEERGFLRRLANRARALEVVRLPEGSSSTSIQPKNLMLDSAHSASNNDPDDGPDDSRDTRARTMPVAANDVMEIPLHGRIAAGVPIEALEGQSALAVPSALLGSGDHYALEVSGDSMVEAGILDGDYALIQKTDVARNGEIVVALIQDEEATLKYLYQEAGQVRLDPANAAYESQTYHPDQVRIQGKLTGLLRRYN